MMEKHFQSGDPRRGFSLIELLAGVTILTMIMVMMGAMFADTTRAWKAGTGRSVRTSAGRASLDFMVREMSSALVDEQLTMSVGTDRGYFMGGAKFTGKGLFDSPTNSVFDAAFFVTAADCPSTNWERGTREVVYFVTRMRDSDDQEIPNRYRLVRAVRRNADKMEAYQDKGWAKSWVGSGISNYRTVIENISAFELFTYGENSSKPVDDWNSENLPNGNPAKDMLPLYLEIYMEVLSEQDAIRAAAIADGSKSEATTYVNRRAKRYVARVDFENREMYVENE